MFGHKEPGLHRAFLSKTLIVDGEVVGTTPTRSVARPTGLRPLASIRVYLVCQGCTASGNAQGAALLAAAVGGA